MLETSDGGVLSKWNGFLESSVPDLTGNWAATALNKALHTTATQTDDFVSRTGEPGVFNILDGTTGDTVGEAIVTSRNRVRAHVAVDSQDVALAGTYNSKRQILLVNSSNGAKQKIVIEFGR